MKSLLSEIYDYAWETSPEGRNAKEEPSKENDHAMDALRYMVMAVDCGSSKEIKVASARRSDGRFG